MNDRIVQLHQATQTEGTTVVYVMSRDQRAQDNHALIAAQQDALEHGCSLIVLCNLRLRHHRSREHYAFMLDGLEHVASDLQDLAVPFVLQYGDPIKNTLATLSTIRARSVYFDFSPLAGPRRIAKAIASEFTGSSYVVDTHNIIPVWVTSDKQEFAAHTIRHKIHKQLRNWLFEPNQAERHPYKFTGRLESLSFDAARQIIADVPACGIEHAFKSGEAAAHEQLHHFLDTHLASYARGRNDPAQDQQSDLSPYLHYGQLSALRVAMEAMQSANSEPLLLRQPRIAQAGDSPSIEDGMNALFEEMIVRKELSDNFCFYRPHYQSINGAPEWAQRTLTSHASDPRTHTYSRDEWERAETHDSAWNAAQNQLRRTGKLHGYMRMYWAKKMLEWSVDPESAIADCVYLNDKYSLDGGDPNGYVGILWSIAGLHDRPWAERPIFGKVRYMNAAGLQRKFDLPTYIDRYR